MKLPLLIAHIRDILILPFTVVILVPYFIFEPRQHLIPENLLMMSIGFVSIIGGVSLFIYTLLLFNNIGKGTLAPWTTKQRLIIIGPYRYCRNPMIAGVLFMLTGEALVLHSTNIVIWTVFFFVSTTLYFIVSEEPELLKRFGDEYRIYKQHVPRWIPRLTPYHG